MELQGTDAFYMMDYYG